VAKRQSRRSVSLNRSVYEAAKKEADRRGQTLAAFVESAIAAAGVPVVAHPQKTLAEVEAHPARKAKRISARRNDTKPRRPSRERQLLGDGVANALGFP
jgi:hypothetical protein